MLTSRCPENVAENLGQGEEPTEEEIKDRDCGCEEVAAVDGDVEILLRDLCEDLSNAKTHIQVVFNINQFEQLHQLYFNHPFGDSLSTLTIPSPSPVPATNPNSSLSSILGFEQGEDVIIQFYKQNNQANRYKFHMIPLQSPQYSGSSKSDLFSKQRSPSFRNKRVPSVQEPFLCFSNQHLKYSKNDSPSKFSQEIRRRKSQHMDANLNSSNGKKKSKVINNSTKDLMSSIQDLKQQYKTLRQAYKELIHEKVKNAEEISSVKQENHKLKVELEECQRNQLNCKDIIQQLNTQNDQLRKELESQKKKNLQLQNDLYFLREKTELVENSSKGDLCEIDPQKLAQQPTKGNENHQQIYCQSFSSESNILSFSLTSVLQDSVSQQKTSRKHQHLKVLSNLTHFNGEFENVQIKPKKESISGNFKKNKKDSVKLELMGDSKESKALSMINPLNQLLSLKSPVSGDKKGFKNLASSNSKRKREEKQNIEPRGCKKKSKKLLQLGSPQ